MIIKCDEEGKNTILSMLDVCLKSGGMRSRDVVNQVFECLEDVDPEPLKEVKGVEDD